jgi:hypothetical protein
MDSRNWEKEKDIKLRLSERIISYFIGKYVKVRYRMWLLRKEANESKLNFQDLRRICSEHVLPVISPLALIAQIQGSGGALLSQLFDGHSELHAHPHELMIGYPEKHVWPKIDLDDPPEKWFEILFEDIVSEYNREGYKKDKENQETFPFIFIPSLQREIFLNYLDSVQFITLRDVFDAYMTSYFGAWLSNQNYNGPKKSVTAFSPRLAMTKENMELFFEVYPDGRLISLVRDPKSWFSSARKRWPGSYADVGQATSEWNESAKAMLWNRERYGDRVCLIQFEDLIRKTEAVMRLLAEFLGIEFDDILLTPTFNTLPLEVNTSFQVEDHGIVDSPLSTERTLTGQEVDAIERMTSETYQLVLRETVRFE